MSSYQNNKNYFKGYSLKMNTKSLSTPKFITLSQAFFPLDEDYYRSSSSELFNLTRDIIAGVVLEESAVNISLFKATSRKPLLKKVLPRNCESHDVIIGNISTNDKSHPNILVIRSDTNAFQFLSLRLRVLFELRIAVDSLKESYLCCANGKIITWFKDGVKLFYWKPFESQPYESLELPFPVGSHYSLLPNRNLLILCGSDGKQLLFVDITKNQVMGTTKFPGETLHRVVNNEDRVITSWFSWSQGACYWKYYCHVLTPELELKELGKIEVNGHGSRIFTMCGASVFLRISHKGASLVEVGTEKIVSQTLARPRDERYFSIAEIGHYKKMVCLLTEGNKLLLLQIGELK